jgi:hypothetical protein
VRQKIISAVIYLATVLFVGMFFDGLFGGEPITRHKSLVYAATFGLILFAASCVLSFFSQRFAVIIGLTAAVLSWPLFAIELFAVPWGDLVWFTRYRPDTLAAILVLIMSSAYSVYALRALVRSPH